MAHPAPCNPEIVDDLSCLHLRDHSCREALAMSADDTPRAKLWTHSL